ncbi:MAG: TniQ family protein [Pseudomonadota bacterium]|uniref:TniQ family protein n=1 Tax=Pseudooceanicola nitratireducens TaxID=517719 RepID=UPI002ECD1E30|nr:TniQ family protein [Pseudomonadota bacterium]
MNGRLPVVLPPVPGELFSSWIARHAAFYGVPSLTMLRHCLPEAVSLHIADRTLSRDQAGRLAEMFSMDAKTVRQMTFANLQRTAHRFISKEPIQRCASCKSGTSDPGPILRCDLQGWRITCPHCSRPFQDSAQCDRGRPFDQYHAAALRGEKLLNDDAERDIQTWTSPLELARLLLMRRVPWPLPRDAELWRYRVLGVVITDLDDVIAREGSFPPSPKHPIVPLHIRPALLAGVAIVERVGPEMLQMLQAHTFGHNRNRFVAETDHLVNPAFGLPGPRQMQLI